MNKCFLIRKEVLVQEASKGYGLYPNYYDIELEVIKEINFDSNGSLVIGYDINGMAFSLNEIIHLRNSCLISELEGTSKYVSIRGYHFNFDCFITMEDLRDKKLEKILE